MDVEAISGIPHSTRCQDDFWARRYEKKGVFSVRSANRMLVSNRERTAAWRDGRPGKSDFKSEEKEWTSLWQVQVPSNIKMFLCGDWLGSRFLLVTCYIIGKWQRAVHMLSVVWRIHGDTLWSLLECNLAKCVWALEKEDITEFIGCLQEQDARAWLAQTFSSLPQEDLVCVTINMWTIWYARRKAIHEGIFQSFIYTQFCRMLY